MQAEDGARTRSYKWNNGLIVVSVVVRSHFPTVAKPDHILLQAGHDDFRKQA